MVQGLLEMGIPQTTTTALSGKDAGDQRDALWKDFTTRSTEIVSPAFSARTRELAARLLSRVLPQLRPSSLQHLLMRARTRSLQWREEAQGGGQRGPITGLTLIRSLMAAIGSCLTGPTSRLAGPMASRTASSLISLVRTLAMHGFDCSKVEKVEEEGAGQVYADTWAMLVRNVVGEGLSAGTRSATRSATFRWHVEALKRSALAEGLYSDATATNATLAAALAVLGGITESIRSGVVVQVDKALRHAAGKNTTRAASGGRRTAATADTQRNDGSKSTGGIKAGGGASGEGGGATDAGFAAGNEILVEDFRASAVDDGGLPAVLVRWQCDFDDEGNPCAGDLRNTAAARNLSIFQLLTDWFERHFTWNEDRSRKETLEHEKHDPLVNPAYTYGTKNGGGTDFSSAFVVFGSTLSLDVDVELQAVPSTSIGPSPADEVGPFRAFPCLLVDVPASQMPESGLGSGRRSGLGTGLRLGQSDPLSVWTSPLLASSEPRMANEKRELGDSVTGLLRILGLLISSSGRNGGGTFFGPRLQMMALRSVAVLFGLCSSRRRVGQHLATKVQRATSAVFAQDLTAAALSPSPLSGFIPLGVLEGRMAMLAALEDELRGKGGDRLFQSDTQFSTAGSEVPFVHATKVEEQGADRPHTRLKRESTVPPSVLALCTTEADRRREERVGEEILAAAVAFIESTATRSPSATSSSQLSNQGPGRPRSSSLTTARREQRQWAGDKKLEAKAEQISLIVGMPVELCAKSLELNRSIDAATSWLLENGSAYADAYTFHFVSQRAHEGTGCDDWNENPEIIRRAAVTDQAVLELDPSLFQGIGDAEQREQKEREKREASRSSAEDVESAINETYSFPVARARNPYDILAVWDSYDSSRERARKVEERGWTYSSRPKGQSDASTMASAAYDHSTTRAGLTLRHQLGMTGTEMSSKYLASSLKMSTVTPFGSGPSHWSAPGNESVYRRSGRVTKVGVDSPYKGESAFFLERVVDKATGEDVREGYGAGLLVVVAGDTRSLEGDVDESAVRSLPLAVIGEQGMPHRSQEMVDVLVSRSSLGFGILPSSQKEQHGNSRGLCWERVSRFRLRRVAKIFGKRVSDRASALLRVQSLLVDTRLACASLYARHAVALAVEGGICGGDCGTPTSWGVFKKAKDVVTYLKLAAANESTVGHISSPAEWGSSGTFARMGDGEGADGLQGSSHAWLTKVIADGDPVLCDLLAEELRKNLQGGQAHGGEKNQRQRRSRCSSDGAEDLDNLREHEERESLHPVWEPRGMSYSYSGAVAFPGLAACKLIFDKRFALPRKARLDFYETPECKKSGRIVSYIGGAGATMGPRKDLCIILAAPQGDDAKGGLCEGAGDRGDKAASASVRNDQKQSTRLEKTMPKGKADVKTEAGAKATNIPHPVIFRTRGTVCYRFSYGASVVSGERVGKGKASDGGGAKFGYRFRCSPVHGLRWRNERETIHGRSILFACWLLDVALDVGDKGGGGTTLGAMGNIGNPEVFSALTTHLRTPSAFFKARVVQILIRILDKRARLDKGPCIDGGSLQPLPLHEMDGIVDVVIKKCATQLRLDAKQREKDGSGPPFLPRHELRLLQLCGYAMSERMRWARSVGLQGTEKTDVLRKEYLKHSSRGGIDVSEYIERKERAQQKCLSVPRPRESQHIRHLIFLTESLDTCFPACLFFLTFLFTFCDRLKWLGQACCERGARKVAASASVKPPTSSWLR